MTLTQVRGDGLHSGAISTVNSDGGAVTTSVVQGLAKAWQTIDGDVATPVFNNSFNTSSLTDVGEGRQTVNFSNSFSTIFYAAVGSACAQLTDSGYELPYRIGVKNTGTHKYATTNTGHTSFLDAKVIDITQMGDLA
jgi:hypothetical protein